MGMKFYAEEVLIYIVGYFPHIQLAIKQHYCGTDIGFPLEAFEHLEIKHRNVLIVGWIMHWMQ